jgi:hypothetical protein
VPDTPSARLPTVCERNQRAGAEVPVWRSGSIVHGRASTEPSHEAPSFAGGSRLGGLPGGPAAGFPTAIRATATVVERSLHA